MKKTIIVNGEKQKVDYKKVVVSDYENKKSFSKDHCNPNEVICSEDCIYTLNNQEYNVTIKYKSTSRIDSYGWYGQEIQHIFKNRIYPNDKQLLQAIFDSQK